MDAVGIAGEGDIDAIVDEEQGAMRGADFAQLARECEQLAPGEILLAKLHRDEAAVHPRRREDFLACGREAILRELSIGDQVQRERRMLDTHLAAIR